MATPETKDHSHRFLSEREQQILKDRSIELGRQSAQAGSEMISINLQKLVDLAVNGKTDTSVPANFLTGVSAYLWENGTSVETVFGYYKRWFQFKEEPAPNDHAADVVNEVQASFVILAGKITIKEKTPQKKRQAIAATIDLIDKNSSKQEDKVAHLIYYGKYLYDHKMEEKGKQIIRNTAKLSPNIVNNLKDLNEIVRKVS